MGRKGEKKKKTGRGSKTTLCFLVIGSAQKSFSWKTARLWLVGEGGAEGVFFLKGLGRDVNHNFGEKEVCSGVCWSPPLWRRHGPFSGSAALGLQRGDFFIYLFDFMPRRPPNGPVSPSENALSPFVAAHLHPLKKDRRLMAHCSLHVVVFSLVEEGPGELEGC